MIHILIYLYLKLPSPEYLHIINRYITFIDNLFVPILFCMLTFIWEYIVKYLRLE